MKFKARIELTKEQSEEARKCWAENTTHVEIEFTLLDFAYFITLGEKEIPYYFRELFIPWLLKGNEPEVLEEEKN